MDEINFHEEAKRAILAGFKENFYVIRHELIQDVELINREITDIEFKNRIAKIHVKITSLETLNYEIEKIVDCDDFRYSTITLPKGIDKVVYATKGKDVDTDPQRGTRD